MMPEAFPFGHYDRCHVCKGKGVHANKPCARCGGRGVLVAQAYQCMCVCGCTRYTIIMVCDVCLETCALKEP